MEKKVNNLNVLAVSFFFICEFGVVNGQSCWGEKRPLVIDSQMPYVSVSVGGSKGYFLMDFGTTGSTIDPMRFYSGPAPKPVNQTTNQFDSFDFFGSWGNVTLSVQDHGNIKLKNVKQAGILGTDFLSLNIFTLDFESQNIYRSAQNSFCNDDELLGQGYKSASTIGYYSNSLDNLNNSCTPNIPTVPVRIGAAYGVAQIDPGFDDSFYHNSVNINLTFFNSILATGLKLKKIDSISIVLSTCVPGVTEKVSGYKLNAGQKFEIIGTNGTPIIISDDAMIFVKDTPSEAKKCGGIGTWQIPAAQIGASFLVECKAVIFDPFKSIVWFKK